MRPTDVMDGRFALFRDTRFAAQEWINVYCPDDYALKKWALNNSLGKYLNVNNLVNQFWPNTYTSTATAGPPWKRVHMRSHQQMPGLQIYDRPFDPNKFGLGPNTYEVLAFIAVSDTRPMGQVTMPTLDRGWKNVALSSVGFDPNMPGGKGRPNHSFEFLYDSATTWAFWSIVMAKVGSK